MTPPDDPSAEPGEPDEPEEADEAARTEADRRVRRERRARVFGDVLPGSTRDERPEGWSEREGGEAGSEEWLRRQVPPHHG